MTVVEEASDEPAGFIGGLTMGWAALVSFAEAAATMIGVLLPWLAAAVPLVAPLIFLARRRRRPAAARPETQVS